MDISREATYLTMLLGVAVTSIGLLYILNINLFVSMPTNVQLGIIWFSIGVLCMLTGIIDMFEGAQAILNDFRQGKPVVKEEKK